MDEVRALCFDVFGTVVDWRTCIARELRDALGPRFGERDWAALADGWRARYQPAMEEIRSGRRPFTKLDVLHRENLVAMLGEAGMGETEADLLGHLNRAWHRLDPWPDSVSGMTRMKRRFVLASLSNGNVALMVNMAKRAGLPWDVILGAEVARAYKPMPEAYLRAADLLDLPPAACMMVAAHNDDLAAAQAVGFRTAFVSRPREHGPAQTSDLEARPGTDLAATDMIDLAVKLGC
ncbi:MAG TPA: haloacid dehalogenase type II [Geminicoccaceae bacterium]